MRLKPSVQEGAGAAQPWEGQREVERAMVFFVLFCGKVAEGVGLSEGHDHAAQEL